MVPFGFIDCAVSSVPVAPALNFLKASQQYGQTECDAELLLLEERQRWDGIWGGTWLPPPASCERGGEASSW